MHFRIDAAANPMFEGNGRLPFPVLTRGDLGVVDGILEEPTAGQKTAVFSLLIHGDESRFYLEPQDRARLIAELEKLWSGFGRYVKACYFYSYHPAATPSWPVVRSARSGTKPSSPRRRREAVVSDGESAAPVTTSRPGCHERTEVLSSLYFSREGMPKSDGCCAGWLAPT